MTGLELITNLIKSCNTDKMVMIWSDEKEDFIPLTSIIIGENLYLFNSDK